MFTSISLFFYGVFLVLGSGLISLLGKFHNLGLSTIPAMKIGTFVGVVLVVIIAPSKAEWEYRKKKTYQ